MLSFFGSPPPAHPAAAIKEANDHLEALYEKNGALQKEVDDLRAIIEEKIQHERELVDANESLKLEYEEKLTHQQETYEEEKENILLQLTELKRKVSVEGGYVLCETQEEVHNQMIVVTESAANDISQNEDIKVEIVTEIISEPQLEGASDEEKGLNDETEKEKDEVVTTVEGTLDQVSVQVSENNLYQTEENESTLEVTDDQTKEEDTTEEENEAVVEETPAEVVDDTVDVQEREGVASEEVAETAAPVVTDKTSVPAASMVTEMIDNERIITVQPQLLQTSDSLISIPGGAVLQPVPVEVDKTDDSVQESEGNVNRDTATPDGAVDAAVDNNRENVVFQLQQTIDEQNEKILSLEREVSHLNDPSVDELSKKAGILDQILKYKSALKTIIVCLEQADQLNVTEVSDDNNNIESTDNITANLDIETNV